MWLESASQSASKFAFKPTSESASKAASTSASKFASKSTSKFDPKSAFKSLSAFVCQYAAKSASKFASVQAFQFLSPPLERVSPPDRFSDGLLCDPNSALFWTITNAPVAWWVLAWRVHATHLELSILCLGTQSNIWPLGWPHLFKTILYDIIFWKGRRSNNCWSQWRAQPPQWPKCKGQRSDCMPGTMAGQLRSPACRSWKRPRQQPASSGSCLSSISDKFWPSSQPLVSLLGLMLVLHNMHW